MLCICLFVIVCHHISVTITLKAELKPELNNFKSDYPVYTKSDISLIECVRLCGYDIICLSIFFYNETCQHHGTTYTNVTGLVYHEGYRYYTLDKVVSASRCHVELGYIFMPISNMCIRFSVDEMKFHQAQGVCRTEGGHLLVINSITEKDYIKSILPIPQYYWISGTDEAVEGDWRIWNGQSMSYLFSPTEDIGPAENCAFIFIGIGDANCYKDKHFICQIDL